MDDAAADAALLGEGANLGHHVVARLALDLQGPGDIDAIDVGLQVGQLLGRHQPGDVLRRGQRHPHLPHQPPLVRLRPEIAHRLAAVAPGEGGGVGLVISGRHGSGRC